MQSMAESDIRETIINPHSAVVFDDLLFTNYKQEIAKEDWVLKNSKLIDEDGAEKWLSQLLEQLQAKPAKDSLNLSLVIEFSDGLKGEHALTVTPETWVQANTKLIKELGAAEWLYLLLGVLETGGPTPKG